MGKVGMSEERAKATQIALLRGLRAVRHYRPEPVAEAALADLLDVARWTGSARNRQPWEIVVVRDGAVITMLAACEGSVGHLAGAPLVLALAMDEALPEQAVYDEGRLAERIMLAAAAHGVGGCIGWFKEGGVAAARALLGVPVDRRLRTVLALGYPDAAARADRSRPDQPRKPMVEIVHHGRYGVAGTADA